MNAKDSDQALRVTCPSTLSPLAALLAASVLAAELEQQIEAARIEAGLGPALARSLIDELKTSGTAHDLGESLRASPSCPLGLKIVCSRPGRESFDRCAPLDGLLSDLVLKPSGPTIESEETGSRQVV